MNNNKQTAPGNPFDINELFRQRSPEEVKHTPLPWRIGPFCKIQTDDNERKDICEMITTWQSLTDANEVWYKDIEFITKAVNNHYQLLEACKHLVKIIEKENEAFYNKHIEAFNIGIETIKNAEQ